MKKGLIEIFKFGVYLAVPIGLALAITVPTFRRNVLSEFFAVAPSPCWCGLTASSPGNLGLNYPTREQRSPEQLEKLEQLARKRH